MLYEVTFPDGNKAEYADLAPVKWEGLVDLIKKYNKPFKITPVDDIYPTKYCYPTVEEEWIGMYFSDYHTNGTVPIFCVVKNRLGKHTRKDILERFTHYFSLPENLDPAYVP